jgi:hypothetical protein
MAWRYRSLDPPRDGPRGRVASGALRDGEMIMPFPRLRNSIEFRSGLRFWGGQYLRPFLPPLLGLVGALDSPLAFGSL